jgi:hypothetical protein
MRLTLLAERAPRAMQQRSRLTIRTYLILHLERDHSDLRIHGACLGDLAPSCSLSFVKRRNRLTPFMAIPTFRLVEKAAPDEVLPRLILVDGDRQQRAEFTSGTVGLYDGN